MYLFKHIDDTNSNSSDDIININIKNDENDDGNDEYAKVMPMMMKNNNNNNNDEIGIEFQIDREKINSVIN